MTASPEPLPPVSRTALGVAGLRFLESGRPDRLFDDPLAGSFVAAGRSLFPRVKEPEIRDDSGPDLAELFAVQVAVRTRFDVSGASSDVTISRSAIGSNGTNVSIAPGVTGTDVAENTFNSGGFSSGVLVDGATNTDVTSNTSWPSARRLRHWSTTRSTTSWTTPCIRGAASPTVRLRAWPR